MRRYCAHESGHLPCRRLPGEAEEDDGGLVLYRRAGESYSCFDSLHKGDQICLLTMLLPPSSFRSLLFMSPLPSAPRTKAIDLQIGLEHASIDAPGPKRLNRHLRLDTLRPTLSCRHDRSAHFDQHTSTNALRPTHFDQHTPINTLRSTHFDQHTSTNATRPKRTRDSPTAAGDADHPTSSRPSNTARASSTARKKLHGDNRPIQGRIFIYKKERAWKQ
jgi:hypothetical protein